MKSVSTPRPDSCPFDVPTPRPSEIGRRRATSGLRVIPSLSTTSLFDREDLRTLLARNLLWTYLRASRKSDRISTLAENPVLNTLVNRYSTPARELAEPAPDDADIATLLSAAVTAPDHGLIRPWRFLIIRGEARRALGNLLVESLLRRNPEAGEDEIEKQRGKPMRAPLIIVVAAHIQRNNPKVPELEQILSAGCAAQHIQLAANAMGYGSIWLTGASAADWAVAEALGLEFDDKIIGYIYLGTPTSKPPLAKRPDPTAYASEWTGPVSPRSVI